MSASGESSERDRRRRRGRTVFAVLLALAAPAAAEEPPTRVVSMNVCTDQLAMMIAGEGQLHSVSALAADPAMSVRAEEAGDYRLNHGSAEEIFLMRPDLVLAGAYTTREAVVLLERLGFRVEEFAPAGDFDEIRRQIGRMGALLGRDLRAEELIAAMDAELAALGGPDSGLDVAIYAANSYTAGIGTLPNAVVEKAGLDNVAAELGLSGVARLPLEQLVAAKPDLVVSELRSGAPALAEENFAHPAFVALAGDAGVVGMAGRYWTCGTPDTVEAVRILRAAARRAQ